jgi:hypothetical protein
MAERRAVATAANWRVSLTLCFSCFERSRGDCVAGRRKMRDADVNGGVSGLSCMKKAVNDCVCCKLPRRLNFLSFSYSVELESYQLTSVELESYQLTCSVKTIRMILSTFIINTTRALSYGPMISFVCYVTTPFQ